MKLCVDCKFCILKEEPEPEHGAHFVFMCAAEVHPEDYFDATSYDDDRFDFAKGCAKFSSHQPMIINLEGEPLTALTPEQQDIHDDFFGR